MIEAYSPMDPVCLDHVGDNEVIESALSSGSDSGVCQSGLRVNALDSVNVVQLLVLRQGRPKSNQKGKPSHWQHNSPFPTHCDILQGTGARARVAILRGVETDIEDSVGGQCFLFAELEGCASATEERSGCDDGETHRGFGGSAFAGRDVNGVRSGRN